MSIYLAMANTTYESGDVICAFHDRVAADEFVAQCNAHLEVKPPCPADIENTSENDAEWEAWRSRFVAWENSHPAGSSHYAYYDSFSVAEIPVR